MNPYLISRAEFENIRGNKNSTSTTPNQLLSKFVQSNNNQHVINSKQRSEHNYNIKIHQFHQLNQNPQFHLKNPRI